MVCSYLFSPAMRTAPSSLRWKPSGPPIHHCHWNKHSTRHLGTQQYFAVSLPWQKFLSEHVHTKSTNWCQGAWYIGMGDNRQPNMFMKMSADWRGRSDHLASDFNHMWDHLDRSSYFCLQAKLQDKDWGLKQEWRDSIWSKQGSCAGTSSLSSSWTWAVDMTSIWKVPNLQKSRHLVSVSWVLRICTPWKFNMDTKPYSKLAKILSNWLWIQNKKITAPNSGGESLAKPPFGVTLAEATVKWTNWYGLWLCDTR